MRLYMAMVDSPAWQCLADSSRMAYLALLRQKRSTNNGNISLPLTVSVHWGIRSDATLAKALRELCAVGLIAPTRRGGSEKDGKRQCTLYRFTDDESYSWPHLVVEASPATNDWKRVKNIAMGKALIRDYIAAEKAAAKKTKPRLQILKGTPSISEGVSPKTTSKIEDGGVSPPQKMKMVRAPPMEELHDAATT